MRCGSIPRGKRAKIGCCYSTDANFAAPRVVAMHSRIINIMLAAWRYVAARLTVSRSRVVLCKTACGTFAVWRCTHGSLAWHFRCRVALTLHSRCRDFLCCFLCVCIRGTAVRSRRIRVALAVRRTLPGAFAVLRCIPGVFAVWRRAYGVFANFWARTRRFLRCAVMWYHIATPRVLPYTNWMAQLNQ